MRRIEALGSRSKATLAMSGYVLADELDPELQALTEQTSHALGMPLAAITLVLENVQLFRAFHGFPPDLAVARAADRDVSFCQFVVRDGVILEVNDAASDPRVPQALVAKYGIASYLGAPIALGGEIVGSMCAIDVVPRQFSSADRELITRMAAAASKRFEILAMQPRARERSLHERAVRPVFGELRNRLQPMLGNVGSMDAAIAELAAFQRLARYAAETNEVLHLDLITRSARMIEELQQCMADVTEDAAQIHRAVIALERATVAAGSTCALADVIETATTLAFHRTKLVAGLRWSGERRATLRVPRPVAVNVIGAAIDAVSERLYARRIDGGVDAAITMEGPVVVLGFASGLSRADLVEVAEQLQLLLGDTPHIAVAIEESILEIEIATRVGSGNGRRVYDLDRPAS